MKNCVLQIHLTLKMFLLLFIKKVVNLAMLAPFFITFNNLSGFDCCMGSCTDLLWKMVPEMIHFEIILVTCWWPFSDIAHWSTLESVLVDFWLPLGNFLNPSWLLLGSLSVLFGVLFDTFYILWAPLSLVGYPLAYLGSYFLILYVTELHFYASPYNFLEHSAAFAVYGALSTGRGWLSRKRRWSAAPAYGAQRAE